jgi:hypothetical protein
MTLVPTPGELAPATVGGKVTDVAHVRDASSVAYADSRVAAGPTATTSVRGQIIADWTQLLRHGCVGDGLTDDSAGFQAACNEAAGFNGGKVIVPPGREFLVQDIEIPTGLVLEGVSRNRYSSRLKLKTAGHNILHLGSRADNVHIRYLAFHGTGLGYDGTDTCGVRMQTAGADYLVNPHIDHCHFSQLDRCIYVGELPTNNNSYNMLSIDDTECVECSYGVVIAALNCTAWRITRMGSSARVACIYLSRPGFGVIHTLTGYGLVAGSALIRSNWVNALSIYNCNNEAQDYMYLHEGGAGVQRINFYDSIVGKPIVLRSSVQLTFNGCAVATDYGGVIKTEPTSDASEIYVHGTPFQAAAFDLHDGNVVRRNGTQSDITDDQPIGFPYEVSQVLTTTNATTLVNLTTYPSRVCWHDVRVVATVSAEASLAVVVDNRDQWGNVQTHIVQSGTLAAGEHDLGTIRVWGGANWPVRLIATAGLADVVAVSAYTTLAR